MLYQSKELTAIPISKLYQGKSNDVIICKRADGAEGLYVLLSIHDHEIANQFIKMIEASQKMPCYQAVFTNGNTVSVAFEYMGARPLKEFLGTVPKTVEAYQSLCIEMTLRCMESAVPFPLLYLMLQQNQFHLTKEGHIFLSYAVNLAELDLEITEKQCVMLLSGMVRDLLSQVSINKNTSYQLLLKKIPKQRYSSFRELYRDLCLSKNEKRVSFWTRLLLLWNTHKSQIMKIAGMTCIVLFLIALVCILSEAIFGEIPFVRMFTDGFRTIGTETLY